MLCVMLDTNVIYSALFYPSEIMLQLFKILENCNIILPDYILQELMKNVKKKMPQREEYAKYFEEHFPYTKVEIPTDYNGVPEMRDEKDRPILAAAIKNDIDCFITGDKDFLALKDIVKKPAIMTVQEFIGKYYVKI